MLKTPVLLITFNRPSHVARVLSEIRKQQPTELFVFQDGPREGNENDIIRINEVREVITNLVDWPCSLQTLFQEKNLGCGPGPMTALNWFLTINEMGIILEDDAVPHQDFFGYADELLNKYKNDNSVRAIGSMNVDTHTWGNGSYYFSMMNRNLCAWATWRRAWNDFDLYLRDTKWQDLDISLRHYGCGFYEREYWLDRLKEAQKDGQGGKSWDMQFFMSIWLHRGKGIIPNVNLCSNIGTVGEATHCMAAGNIIDNIPTKSILPLIHPSNNSIQSCADREFHRRYFEPQKNSILRMISKLNKRIKRIIGHEGSWI